MKMVGGLAQRKADVIDLPKCDCSSTKVVYGLIRDGALAVRKEDDDRCPTTNSHGRE